MAKKKTSKSRETATKEEVVNSKLSRRKLIVIVLIIGIALLAYYKKGWFVAATVNGQPIYNFELLSRIYKQFGQQTLNQMINEKILDQEVAKKGVSVTPQQVNDKIAALETQYGGKENLDSLLSQQGLTREDFIHQTRLQLLVERLFENEAKPTEEEIKKFMEENKNLPEATETAKFKEIATQQVKQQKLSKAFNERFDTLKKESKVNRF